MKDKILIVDDEAGIRKVLKLYLEDAGFDVITASGAKNGLRKFREDKPGIVMTDVLMPGGGGCEVFRIIKEESPCTKVILLTGLGEKEMREICEGYSGISYVFKPIDYDALKAALEKDQGEGCPCKK